MKKIYPVFILTMFFQTVFARDKNNYVNDSINVVYSYDKVYRKPYFLNLNATDFNDWITWNVEYTQEMRNNNVCGNVVVSFIISKTGEIEKITLLQSVYNEIDKQIISAICKSPKWIPGYDKDGNAVNTVIYATTTIISDKLSAENTNLGRHNMDDFANYKTIAMKPKFNNGNLEVFKKWVIDNIEYPKNGIKNGVQKKILVEFIVDRNGAIRNLDVIDGINEETDKAVLRSIFKSPQWQPGRNSSGNIVQTVIEMQINLNSYIMTKKELRVENKDEKEKRKEINTEAKEHARYEKELAKEKRETGKEKN